MTRGLQTVSYEENVKKLKQFCLEKIESTYKVSEVCYTKQQHFLD